MSRTNEPRTVASDATGVSPRALNVALGAWLFVSAFAWPHTRWQFISTAIPGLQVVAFALAACVAPRVRYLNTTLGAYLFVSAWFYSSTTLPELATQWHNAIIGLWNSSSPSSTTSPSVLARQRHPGPTPEWGSA